MTLRASMALLPIVLTACGGGISEFASDPNRVLVGDAPITEVVYIDTPFPFRFIGRDTSDASLIRSIGTARFISETEIEISLDDLTDTLTEGAHSTFSGSILTAVAAVEDPALISIFAQDGFAQSYSGFMGFEARPSDIPETGAFLYSAIDASTLLVSDGASTQAYFGQTYLSLSFELGIITGSLHTSIYGDVTLVDGTLTENGIIGRASLRRFGVEIPAVTATTNSDVEGTFFNADASRLAGTFEGTSLLADETEISFVGTFLGEQWLFD